MNIFRRNKAKEIPQTNTNVQQVGVITNFISNVGNIMGNASVMRAISAIANAISILEISEYKLINGNRIPIDSNIEYLLNCSPNDFLT